jgi:Tol biopolymer transport system component
VRWSKDSNQLAALVLGVLKDGRRGDLVQVFSVSRCIPNPLVVVQFPQPHFSYSNYDKNPTIQDITWDGDSLFVFHDNKRNDGFGDLHLFNIETFQPNLSINPVRNVCCYRDPQWSPDGSYLVFAFQNIGEGSKSVTRLYYVPYGSIGTGGSYEPLPLPEISDPEEKPQPVLRPASAP